MSNPVEKAVKNIGSVSETARIFKVSRQAVQQWIIGRIPAEKVLQMEHLSGIDRYSLRPDVYGKRPK